MLKFRTIIHPTDFSATSMYAFGLARALAKESGAVLMVVHVVPDRRARNYRNCGEAYEALRRLTAADPAVRMYPLLLRGDPASQIVCSADQQDGDLIVMGTGGRTGLRRFLPGSVAAAVRRNARCPVVTARLPATGRWEQPGVAEEKSTVSAHGVSQLAA